MLDLTWCVTFGEFPVPLSLSLFICKVGMVKGVIRSQWGHAFKYDLA